MVAQLQYNSSIDRLLRKTSEYLNAEDVAKIREAWQLSRKAHKGQERASGEPYISHPIAVANILADMHLDRDTLAAALLHDVIEDTKIDKQDIATLFGKEVANLVDGVSKVSHLSFRDLHESQSLYFRKMLMAISNDIRVILVKLADRLHNMGTLSFLSPHKQYRTAKETLEIYAPIAHRLGMQTVRLQLEDLSFATLYPFRFRVMTCAVNQTRGNRREFISTISTAIQECLDREKISATILGREKNLYSIYRKMRDKKIPFNHVYDLFAFRIIVDHADDCYRALGILHHLYKPKPGGFKDYIAIPKTNGYQSLHTILFGPHRFPIEIQIRTKAMEEMAEAGIAAHWLYKSNKLTLDKTGSQKRVRTWIRQLLDSHSQTGNTQNFLESVRGDLIPDSIYVFTPQGKIVELPREATAVDFAYYIHTDIGNHCIAVQVDNLPAPISKPLQNGQTIEIITSSSAHPWPSWLDFVVTQRARASIRSYLHRLHTGQAIRFGKQMLEKELQAFSLKLCNIPRTKIRTLLQELKLRSLTNLYHEIGTGNVVSLAVALKLSPESNPVAVSSNPITIKGVEGGVVTFSKCCYPIPGDAICGHISAGRGLVVHRQDCKNIGRTQHAQEKFIAVVWEKEIAVNFPVQVNIETKNIPGILAMVSSLIASENINILNVDIRDKAAQMCTMVFLIEVKNRDDLAMLFRRLRNLKAISRITRG